MPPKPVRIIVDGAIDLPPELIHALDIIVIPRTAKLGWTRVDLTADFTGYSLAQQQPRPRNTHLLLPEKTACIAAFQTALAGDDEVEIISLHLPPEVDEVARQMRMARNMMPRPAAITVVELPLLGMGFAWMVEVVARLARPDWADWLVALNPGRTFRLPDDGGWSREMLTTLLRSLQRHTRSLFITPPTFPYRAKVPSAQRKITVKKPFSATFKSMWALSSSARPPADDKLGIVGYHYEMGEVVRMIHEALVGVAVLPGQAPGARSDTTLRHANLERPYAELQAGLGMVAVPLTVAAEELPATAEPPAPPTAQATAPPPDEPPAPSAPEMTEPSAPPIPSLASLRYARPATTGPTEPPPEPPAPPGEPLADAPPGAPARGAATATAEPVAPPPPPPPPMSAPQAEGFYSGTGWSPAVAACMGRQHIELFAAPNPIFLAGLITLTLRVQREFVDQNGHERQERRIWQQVDRLSPK